MSAVMPSPSNFDATSCHPLSNNMASTRQPGLLQNRNLLIDRYDDTTKLPSAGRTNTSMHCNAAPSQAMLSISPIRCNVPSKTTAVYPTQQLMMRETEELSTPESDGTNRPPLPCPAVSSGYVKNLSNQFVGEETPLGYSFGNQLLEATSASLRADDGSLLIKQESDISKQAPDDLDANLGASYFDFPMPSSHLDASAMDESTLDDFSLASNGSFDFDTLPDPKGIYATKALKMNPNAIKQKARKPSARTSSTAISKSLSVEITEPTDLDILRGRGGLTNRHPGNMRFRDEARKLRAEYRSDSASRQDKFALSQALVKIVKAYGGRFLEKDDEGYWRETSAKAARKKASQVLREEKWD